MTMFKNENFLKMEVQDFSKALYVANPAQYSFYALLAGKGKIEETNSVTIREKVEKCDTYSTTSGGKAEGADFVAGGNVEYEIIENICEIFSETVKISGTAQAVGEKNYINERNKQLKQKFTAMGRAIDKALLMGVKDTGVNRKMDGMKSLSTQKVGTLTNDELDLGFLHLYTHGYINDVYLVINPADKVALDKIILDNKYTVNIDNGAKETIGISVFSFLTNLGFTVNVLLDVNLDKGNFILVDIEDVKIKLLREVQMKELPTMGDYVGANITTELSCVTSKYNTYTIKPD